MMQLSAKRSKEQALRRALWQIRDAIDDYKHAVDDGLIASSVDTSGYPASLQVLVIGIESSKDARTATSEKKKLRFLRQIPRDPFNNNNQLTAEETWAKKSYTSSFDEPAGASNDDSDVYHVHSKSTGLGLNDRPYREW